MLPAELMTTLRARIEHLPAELQRAARWALAHPAEVSLWSMRRQAQSVGVAPATMLRLARAAGYESYGAFRKPFQQSLTQRAQTGLYERAATLQADPARAGQAALTHDQTRALASIGRVNAPDSFDAAARTLLAAAQVGFLGTRSAFGIAYQMRYAFQLLRRNGVLIDGLGGTAAEDADALQAGDALVVISQAPYASASIALTRQALARGVHVVALTDHPLAPVAVGARHTLHFTADDRQAGACPTQQGPGSFFHTTAGLLGLAEHVIARLATLAGPAALERLAHIEARLAEDEVYWTPSRRVAPT
ncbi:MurR/RpiR family transcriptional regulator [Bordetella genomosp. 12]|uniref:Silent information regulator protein Sir2 n=1 Tax=Bordetella genomosp. 12 TaxID=463035 RepID=A0A261VLD1_9BORD|nr:MurR/RpiR family transcriptional regulator [Bordetella genomosp. 12]OZI73983.1 silent information regulator protein Sir2 [Bordetella genomosp. 12]